MIKLWIDNKADWKPQANEEMTFPIMMDLFFNGLKLSNSIGARASEYNLLYQNHKDLVLFITESMIGSDLFVPSQISEEGTKEFYLFEVLTKIIHLTKYYELANKRRYESELRKYKKALRLIKEYSDLEITSNYFPKHKSEILDDLKKYFTVLRRPQQGEKIIKHIKNHFDIKAINNTKKMEHMEDMESHIMEQEAKGFIYEKQVTSDGTKYLLVEIPDSFPNFK